MLYLAYQLQSDIMVPVRAWASMAANAGGPPLLNGHAALRNLTAVYELIARAGLTHTRPPFGITSVTVGNREVEVREEAAATTPFGTLLHFKKDIATAQPRVLLVAPLSGHFSTLLRATVRTMLPDQISRSDGAGLPCAGGVPALRRRARGRRGDGAGRQSGAAAFDDADGRADRHPRQSHQGQRAR